MRFVSFDDFRVGALRGQEVVDLSSAIGDAARLDWDERLPVVAERYGELRGTIERVAREGAGVPRASVRLRAPDPRPRKLLCAIGNFAGRPPEGSPLAVDFTFKSPESVVGPGDAVVLDDVPSTGFEAEATLAVVIGREARKLSASEALSYVFGYTAMLDVFATGLGRPQIGTFFGKSLDTLGPMGPVIVTADELGDPQHLGIRLTVNGATRQDFNTSQMAISVAEVLEAATGIMTLYPGDVVTCGSPATERILLGHDDAVAVEIDGIGRLEVRVEDPARRTWPATVA
jgi:2-keto-4-pentenoate hydratase/2-oxohepta-3-ene-1,7-dioic acid hydratase in catechol pathway